MKEKSTRSVPKAIRLTPYESAAVQFGLACSGKNNFSDFARDALMVYTSALSKKVATDKG